MHLVLAISLMACDGSAVESPSKDPRGEEPAANGPVNSLSQLTDSQYRNTIEDLFGPGIALPSQLLFIDEVEGLEAVGAAISSVSPLGAERFEAAAYQIAAQVVPPEAEAAVELGCAPTANLDSDCAATALNEWGARIWRRPLTSVELDVLVALSDQAATELEDFHAGLEFGFAALLMSPNFLYRQEVGENGALTAYELASRLSYFLWNTLPDELLISAASDGSLLSEVGVEDQVKRMMADARFTQGVDAFFTDLYDLNLLDEMSKDPLVYKHMNSELPAAAREETLRVISNIVVDRKVDFRELFTTRRTWVDRRLAAIYDVQAPNMDGFGWVNLPAEQGRRGLLGQASILSLYAHAVSSSVTLRGIFVRERILCHDIPSPPADVNTSIPEASEALPTMRERVARHLEDPSCATCHEMTDLIGLGLENFDGIARWRSSENGATIDPNGELDGHTFSNAWGLSAVLARHPDVGPCLSNQLFAYATHHTPQWTERETMEWMAQGFSESGFRVGALMGEVATSAAFAAAPIVNGEE